MITLRKAKEEDIEIIRDIAVATWPSTYLDIIGQKQIDYMLDKMYNKGELLKQFMEGYVFLIAEEGENQLGFTGYSIIEHEERIYKLHKLYVLPSAHGKGVGKILINEVFNQVKDAGGSALQLNVNKHNKAKDFYLKGGFTIKESVMLDIGDGYFMDDYVMEYKF
ncbi:MULTISPECIES: GNAT family N-acetyltransferase [unclassified Pedobacter]|uniref:GNAT family N-acetyltransferase n=1 Tax=unclassified Pedobacter TaxID=2628915 RepID=UPI00141DE601|nr:MULTISPECIES: GNAT family N-acetyltransferase [unclassified Pedobacter]NII84200.1 ribosomal protein S18 acetylase RimI-like enzyme [Pedobacter sp. SG908]NMN38884.1 ribosomal protein S18 acetylase RimI-like enzyme [Pedobacter sp. SG918]